MIHFPCPACAKGLKVKPELSGRKVKCPKCSRAVLVPVEAGSPVPAGGSAPGAEPPEEKTRAPRDVPAPDASEQPTLPPANAKTNAPVPKEETHLANQPAFTQDADSSDERNLTDFLAPPQQPDEIGRLGSYRVLKVLGAGGMGVVFKAEDPGLQRLVAIKAMLPAIAASASARKRFLREARAAAALNHTHIVTIHQVGEDRGVPFLAMQFLEGEPLDDRLKREKTLPIAEVVEIGRQMADGLAAAHARGLIHRDIKPANIWLELASGGRQPPGSAAATHQGAYAPRSPIHVKILDFGLARSATDQTHLTQSGAIIGTPAYMAPEQAGGQPVDHRCDLFSLGCVLYRMCTGQLPFQGNSTIAILSAIALATPPAPDEVRAEVPAELSELIMQLLAKKADDRPASAQEVAEALRDLGAGQTSDTAKRPRKDRTVLHRAKAEKTQIMTPLASRKRWLLPAGAAAFLAVAGLAAYLMLGRGSPGPEPTNKPPPNEKPAAADDSPYDKLDANLIPASERFPGQPKELVAVIGTGAHRTWSPIPWIYASPDGKWIATRDDHHVLHFWDTAKHTLKFSLPIPGGIHGVTFLPGKFQVVVGAGHGLILVDGTSGTPKVVPWPAGVDPKDGQGPCGGLQCSSDGTLLAGYQSGHIRVWEIHQGAPRLRHGRKVPDEYPSISLAPQAKLLAYADGNKTFLCDPTGPELKELAAVVHKDPPRSVCLSPDAKVYAIGFKNGTTRLWRWDGKSLLEWKQLDLHGDEWVSFSSDGSRMLSCSGGFRGVYVGRAQLWKVEKDGPVFLGLPIFNNLHGICFAGDGKTVVTVHDRDIHFWDIQGVPKEVDPPDFALAPEKGISVARNGLINYWVGERSHLWQAVGKEPRPLDVDWDVQTKPIMTLSPSGELAAVWHTSLSRVQIMKRSATGWDMVGDMSANQPGYPVFDAGGKLFFLVDGGKMRGLDLSVTPAKENDVSAFAKTPYERPWGLVLSADGRWVGGYFERPTRFFLLWDLKTAPPTLSQEFSLRDSYPYPSAITPRGDLLAGNYLPGPPVIRLWDLSGPKIKQLEAGPANFKANSLSFSPDGKTLAAAGEIVGEPGHLILFEVPSMKIKQQFAPFPGPIHSVHFADDRHLVTHNGNRTLYILRLGRK